jgi:hypothetical protein
MKRKFLLGIQITASQTIGRVRKVNDSLGIHDDVVGTIETTALEIPAQNLNPAITTLPTEASTPVLANDELPGKIERKTIRMHSRAIQVNRDLPAGKAINPAAVNIAEKKVPIWQQYRAFCKLKSGRHSPNFRAAHRK